jgi:alpha-beta hydrolase superfamily lysophospholipase
MASSSAVTATATATAKVDATTEDTHPTPIPRTASTTTESNETTTTTTTTNEDGEDENDTAVSAKLIQNLRRRAPQPWGTKLLDTCRLLSPFMWWGIATIKNIDVKPILTSFMGVVLPVLVYQLAKSGGLIQAAVTAVGRQGISSSRSSGSNIGIWPLSSVAADFSAPNSNSNLLIPYLLSPWTLGMIWCARSPVRQIWSAVRLTQSLRAATNAAAWQSLVEGVESGRVYRTRRYDVYLPPPSAHTGTPISTSNHPHAILFLPGLGVEHVAYSAPATLLSNAGYTVVVVSAEPLLMGLPEMGTTVSAMRRIQQAVERRHYHSDFSSKMAARKKSSTPARLKMTWALLGHSMGSFTACQLAQEFCKSNMGDTEANSKVVMWGSAPFIDYLPDLSGHQRLPILVVQGSRDAIIRAFGTEELTKQFWQRLPEDTAELVLDGGTHSGFANYVALFPLTGEDGINNDEQHRQAVQATVDFLQKD